MGCGEITILVGFPRYNFMLLVFFIHTALACWIVKTFGDIEGALVAFLPVLVSYYPRLYGYMKML